MAKLTITLKKSLIGRLEKHKRTAQALGLKKIGDSVTRDDNEVTRGMIRQIGYMLDVEEAK